MKALFLVFLMSTFANFAFGQCSVKHEIKLNHPQSGGVGQITLSLDKNVSETMLLQLYKIDNGELKLIEEKNIDKAQGVNKTENVSFTDLKPALYYLIAKWANCKSSIGGIEGLLINESGNK